MGILTALLPMIPGIIQIAEKLFPPGSGPDKKAAVTAVVDQFASHLVASKAVEGEKPGADAIGGAIEGVLAQLKTSGTLGAAAVSADLSSAFLFSNGKMYRLAIAEQK